MSATASPPPVPPPPVTVPAFSIGWAKIFTVCGTILVTVGGIFYGLFGIVYANLQDSVSQVEKKVDDIQSKLISAAKDGGALQVLLSEAPDLRKTMQDTHDGVLRHDGRFDTLDRTLATTNEGIADIRARLAALEAAARKRGDLPR